MKFSRVSGITAAALAGILTASCINVDKSIGESLIPDNQLYDIYTAEFPIEDIRQEVVDSLSGYSLYKFTVGAIRDTTFGLTTRSAAFTLVPVNDTLDFGVAGTQVFKKFHFAAVSDSISYDDPTQEHILQNINVYELDEAIDFSKTYPDISYSRKRISDGIPVYNGKDTLSFNFSKEFGEKYMTITDEDLDTLPNYTKKFPGIVITTDAPTGYGGRINMFKLPIDVISSSIYGSFAELKFSAQYGDRTDVDTSFLFYLGPAKIYDMKQVTSTSVSDYPQIAFDMTTHQDIKHLAGSRAGDRIYMEGGRGVKPVIKAGDLREKVMDELAQHTDDPSSIVISKATVVLPFEFPDDYTKMYLYPIQVSPTCRIATDTTVTYAGLSDSSASDENQGDINRSTCEYAPDLSHHIQELIKLKDLSKIDNYDVWLLAMASETISTSTSSTSSSSSYSDYLSSLMYAQYYNNLYGYGGYGYGSYGYSGYSNYYSNYYSYAMLQAMYQQSSSSSSSNTTTSVMMDSHRFYRTVFNGPTAKGRRPSFRITYAVPKSDR